jgi:hypothetical protein
VRRPKLDATYHALFYAERFGPIWPQTTQKTGYADTHGAKDATRDAATIRRMWAEHPDAVPALLTGTISGIIALDIDIKNGRDGRDALEMLGVSTHPHTPTAHTPSGGLHLLFRAPVLPVCSSADKLGPGLEVKGDRAWITLPPGPGRRWDEHLGPHTPMAAMPDWMRLPEPAVKIPTARPSRQAQLSRYGEAALDSAVKAIVSAPAGAQHDTLNREVYAIGGLVAVGVIPAGLALESLTWAARQMPSYDRRNHWHPEILDRQIRDSFVDGQLHPRAVPA